MVTVASGLGSEHVFAHAQHRRRLCQGIRLILRRLLSTPIRPQVCFEETECDAGSWRVFPCQHGVCAKCFDGIVKAHVRISLKPLARAGSGAH